MAMLSDPGAFSKGAEKRDDAMRGLGIEQTDAKAEEKRKKEDEERKKKGKTRGGILRASASRSPLFIWAHKALIKPQILRRGQSRMKYMCTLRCLPDLLISSIKNACLAGWSKVRSTLAVYIWSIKLELTESNIQKLLSSRTLIMIL